MNSMHGDMGGDMDMPMKGKKKHGKSYVGKREQKIHGLMKKMKKKSVKRMKYMADEG